MRRDGGDQGTNHMLPDHPAARIAAKTIGLALRTVLVLLGLTLSFALILLATGMGTTNTRKQGGGW